MYLVSGYHFTVVMNYRGSSYGLISPTENKKIATNTQAVIKAPIKIVKTTGTKKTDQVLATN